MEDFSIRAWEATGRAAQAAHKAGRFVVERLSGGGWHELPNTATREAREPMRVNLSYLAGQQAAQEVKDAQA